MRAACGEEDKENVKSNRIGSMIHLLSPSREGVGGGVASNTLLFWVIDEEDSWGSC